MRQITLKQLNNAIKEEELRKFATPEDILNYFVYNEEHKEYAIDSRPTSVTKSLFGKSFYSYLLTICFKEKKLGDSKLSRIFNYIKLKFDCYCDNRFADNIFKNFVKDIYYDAYDKKFKLKVSTKTSDINKKLIINLNQKHITNIENYLHVISYETKLELLYAVYGTWMEITEKEIPKILLSSPSTVLYQGEIWSQ